MNEKEKFTCPHCNKAIEEDDNNMSTKDHIILTLEFIGIAWFIITLLYWIISGTPLFEVLSVQWDWLTSIKIK